MRYCIKENIDNHYRCNTTFNDFSLTALEIKIVRSCIGSRHAINDIVCIERDIYTMIEELNFEVFH